MSVRNRILGFRMVKASELCPNPKNWRKHPMKQRDALRGVLAEVGYVDAVIARELPNGRLELVDGHLRTDEAEADAEVPCLIVDLDDTETAKVLATFDPITGLAEAEVEKLDKLMREFTTDDPRTERLVQFVARDYGIKRGNGEAEEGPEPQIDRAAELQKEWGTERGQLWEVPGKAGVHRVLCGDARKAEDVERVMDGAKADMLFADPPYGIPEGSAFVRTNTRRIDRGDGDYNAPVAWDWLDKCEWLRVDANLAVFHQRGEVLPAHFKPWHKFYLVKQAPPPTPRPCFVSAVEECSIGTFHDGTRRWFGSGYEPNYWFGLTPNRKNQSVGHPTEKPIEAISQLMRCLCACGETIFEPFLGSGTTLIAAEQLSRVCCGIEISPAYVAVILQRCKDAGLAPRLADNGGPW